MSKCLVAFQKSSLNINKNTLLIIYFVQSSMSIEKRLPTRPYLNNLNQSPVFQYRVRNLSRNQSMKQLTINNNCKKDVLAKINNKYTIDTSFFSKQNINSLQINSQQELPKYSFDNPKKSVQRQIKRNSSHRILRKVNSQQLFPLSSQLIPNVVSHKNSLIKNQERKFSLKKKVQFIKKKHDEDKSQAYQQQIRQVQTEHLLPQKKKSKPKLKLLVRDPFNSSKAIHQRKKAQIFSQSKIQGLNDTSMISQTNREQFEQFLSCLN